MAIAPPSTTAKELRFERSAPPSLVLKRIIYLRRLFFPEVCENGVTPLALPLARPRGRARRCAATTYSETYTLIILPALFLLLGGPPPPRYLLTYLLPLSRPL